MLDCQRPGTVLRCLSDTWQCCCPQPLFAQSGGGSLWPISHPDSAWIVCYLDTCQLDLKSSYWNLFSQCGRCPIGAERVQYVGPDPCQILPSQLLQRILCNKHLWSPKQALILTDVTTCSSSCSKVFATRCVHTLKKRKMI